MLFTFFRVCSTFHALIITCIAITVCFIEDPFVNDMWTPFPPLLDFAFPFYFGYTLYDLITMLFQTHHWTMWLHHYLGLCGSYLMVTQRKGALYPAYFMLTEFTAITDNLFWYFKMLYLPDLPRMQRLFYRNVMLPRIRAATFFLFRVWVGPFSIFKSIQSCGGVAPLIREWMRLPWYVSLPGSFFIFLLCFLNVAWTIVITLKCFNPKVII